MIVLGKHSGRAAFSDAVSKLGFTLEDDDFSRAFDRFKKLADRKGEISEMGIRAIVSEEGVVASDQISLVSLHFSGGSEEPPEAIVTAEQDGERREGRATGDGMVNAAFVALQELFGVPATLIDYRVSPLTSGADAMAEVSVIVQVGAATYSGRGVSTDVVEGSARAFVAALNKTVIDTSGSILGESRE